MSNKSEPVAWIQNAADAIDSALLCSGNNCESLLKENLERDYPRRRKIIIDIISGYAGRAAPALTFELKAELLEALKLGEDAADNELTDAYNADEENPCRYEVIDCRTTELKKIKAAITKLTNLESES